MKWKAAKTSLFLSLLFLVVYNACNSLTALRHDVGTFYFAWERHIPFLPLFIIPYMSIDLFFIAATFFCRDEDELRILCRRISAAILIAGACFLLFPLRFAFERPHVNGPLGVIFNNFRNIDKPFNQCPSLHMALRTILAPAYAQWFVGARRWMLRIWFSLIGFSTIFTYQHHVIDIGGGFALGAVCVYAFRNQPFRLPVTANRRVGIYYLSGAILLLAIAVSTGGWAWLMLWPAISLGLIASAYFRFGPGVFRKERGEIPFSARLMLGPVLLGQRISLALYGRQCNPWHALTPSLWIGRKLSDAEARNAIAQGVSAVVDLSGEFSEAAPFQSIAYYQLSVLDLTAPTAGQIDQALEFIERRADAGVVYIHCKAGYSRTAAIAGAYLIASGQATNADKAAEKLRATRPTIVIRPEAMQALRDFAARGRKLSLVSQ